MASGDFPSLVQSSFSDTDCVGDSRVLPPDVDDEPTPQG